MKFWQTKDFKALQKAWYQRLNDDGFEDAERLIGGDLVLKQMAQHPYRETDETVRQSKETYFAILGAQMHQATKQTFRNHVDKAILTMWSNGSNIKYICRVLTEIGEGRHRETVRLVIRRYERKWGIQTSFKQVS